MTTRRSEPGASIIGEQDNFSAPWPAGFRGQFLRDLAQFIECWGHFPTPPYTYPLPLTADEVRLFTVDVPKYIEDYVKRHTKFAIAHDQGNYAVERYIGQSDDPFHQFRVSRATDLLDSEDMFGSAIPGQLQRDTPSGWPAVDYTGRATVATTSQTFQNHNVEKTFQSTGTTTFTQGSDVRDLLYRQPSPRKSPSHNRSRTGTENVDYKPGGSSSGYKRNVGKQARRGYSHTEPSKKAASTTSRRLSEASKHSGREAKPHECDICFKRFQFDARLRSHMAVHRIEKISCPNCGAEFGRESSLKRHINTSGACEKKKQAKMRPSSGGSSCHGSDGAPIGNNPPDCQSNSGIRPGSNNMARNHIPASPRISQSMYLMQTHPERGAEQHYAQSFPGTSHNQSPQPASNWDIDHVGDYLWSLPSGNGGD